jgi:hypothetical protein
MLDFVLKIIVGRFIKNNYKHIKNGVKYSSKYIYKRLYTTRKEKNYFVSAEPASRSRSASW